MDPLEQSTHAPAVTDRFMSRFVDFETVADGSAATGGAPAGDGPSPTAAAPGAADAAAAGAAGAGGETEPSSAVATVSAPAGPPSFDPSDPEVMATLDAMMEQRLTQLVASGALGGQQAAPAAPADAGPQLLPPDPFSDNYAAELAAWQDAREQQMLGRIEQMIGQVAQPLNQQLEAQTKAEGDQRLKDMLADDVARNGDFPRAPGETESKAEQLVKPLAEMIFPQIAQSFGATPRAAELAMGRAASMIREVIAEASAHAVAAHTNTLGTLAGAPAGAGAGAAGAQVVGEIRARTMEEGLRSVTSRYADALRNGSS